MTHQEIIELLEKSGLPFAYDHFVEGESPEPPFLVFLYPNSSNFAADGKVYFKKRKVNAAYFMKKAKYGLNRKICMRCFTRWRYNNGWKK